MEPILIKICLVLSLTAYARDLKQTRTCRGGTNDTCSKNIKSESVKTRGNIPHTNPGSSNGSMIAPMQKASTRSSQKNLTFTTDENWPFENETYAFSKVLLRVPATTPAAPQVEPTDREQDTWIMNNTHNLVSRAYEICADAGTAWHSVKYMCEFLKQANQYNTHGNVSDDHINDAIIPRFDNCFKPNQRDDCSRQAFCSCESDCILYENCCYDALPKPLEPSQQAHMELKYQKSTCEQMGTQSSWMMVSSCPNTWTNGAVKYQCENRNFSDAVSLIPVYDKELKVSYRNKYCAECHGMNLDLPYWDVNIERCPETFNEVWSLGEDILSKIGKIAQDRKCKIVPTPFDAVRKLPCVESYDNEYNCLSHQSRDFFNSNPDFSDVSIEETSRTARYEEIYKELFSIFAHPELNNRLHDYIGLICTRYMNLVLYRTFPVHRNMVCNWCREKTRNPPTCTDQLARRQQAVVSFSALINFTAAVTVQDKRTTCNEEDVFDCVNNICRRLICPNQLLAFHGDCRTPYISMAGATVCMTFLAPCTVRKADVWRWMKREQYDKMGSISIWNRLYFGETLQVNKTLSMQSGYVDICHVIRRHWRITERLPYQRILEIEEETRFPFVENPLRNDEFIQVEDDSFGQCSERRTKEALQCPHVTLSYNETMAIREKLHRVSSRFHDLPLVPSDEEKHSMCFKHYQEISQLICDQNGAAREGLLGVSFLVFVSISSYGLMTSTIS